MTDNFDEHENGDDFNENEHEIDASENGKKISMAGNLAEAWRSRPLFKFMVLIGAVFAVSVAAISFFGGNSNNSGEASRLGRPPQLSEAPGGAVSPYMKKQTEMADAERTNQAIATGGSALPTPIGQTTDVGNFGALDKKDDPLTELRLETEKLKQQVEEQKVQQQVVQQQVQQRQAAPPVQQQPEQFDNTLAEAMQRQMQQLLEGWSPKGIKSVSVTKVDDTAAPGDKNAAANASGAGGATTAPATTTQPKAIVNAGTVNYAQLLTEANSDVPGPILAQIVSGPLSGARAVGTFQVANGYEKYLVLRFSIADKKGVDYQINAIALDPDTTLGGMATEVDERYFARVILPAAAGFLQGLGQGLSQGNSSITTNGSTSISNYASNGYKQGIYNGLGQGANVAGQFFENQANVTKPLVRVAAGTPMGLFFTAPVYDPSTPAGSPQPQNPSGINGYNGYNGYNGNGYPYGANANPYGANVNPYGANANPYGNVNYPGATVNGYGANSTAAAAIAAGEPYPNYAAPYNSGLSNGLNSAYSPYARSYGQ